MIASIITRLTMTKQFRAVRNVLSAKKIVLAIGFLLAASSVPGYASSFSFDPTTASSGLWSVSGGLNGAVGIESQSGGSNGNYTMVFTFASPLTGVGGVSVASGTGTVKSGVVDSSNPNRYIVNLTGVVDAQIITVRLTNVQSAGGLKPTVSASMGVLIGDTNGDGFVNSADIAQTKSQSGHLVTSSNFREDVNGDGFINSGDIALVKAESGTALTNLSAGRPPPDGVPDSGSTAELFGLALVGIAFVDRRLRPA
jgi:Dockerin type I domain/VPDSG-CTERM motif